MYIVINYWFDVLILTLIFFKKKPRRLFYSICDFWFCEKARFSLTFAVKHNMRTGEREKMAMFCVGLTLPFAVLIYLVFFVREIECVPAEKALAIFVNDGISAHLKSGDCVSIKLLIKDLTMRSEIKFQMCHLFLLVMLLCVWKMKREN